MRLFIALLTLLCFTNSICVAQRSRNQKREKITVDSLIRSYRFSEAAQMLEDDIEKAERRKKSTEDLEIMLERVHSLEVMLSATEKVNFIDSIVVDKNNFLSAFHLGSDCGEIGLATNILPENLKNSSHLGWVAYCNELKDKIYFSQQNKSGLSGLYVTARVGETWGVAKPLKGIAAPHAVQDFPYVLSDGVTMYYADKNPEGLGGYDIYVTRYHSDTDSYLKPENIGMPFNSMANDYLYVIDEINNLGWFVTDRNQPEDKVCIYIFQPNVSREVYNSIAMGEEMMRKFAMIHSIQDSRLDNVTLAKARERLQEVMNEPSSRDYGEKVSYIISDNIVYTSLLDFKNKEAQGWAMEWAKEYANLKSCELKLEKLRNGFDVSTASQQQKKQILELEAIIKNTYDRVAILAKNMRKAELQ